MRIIYICVMIKRILFFLIIVSINFSFSQEANNINSNYLEDQLYVSLSYNLLIKKPDKLVQNGFSGGYSIGFIKDIPLNKNRTFGVGIGFGYAYQAFLQNLKIENQNSNVTLSIAEDFSTNKMVFNQLDFPVEIRFRNSNAIKYKFWRIYPGIKFSYLLSSKAKFKDSNSKSIVKNSNIFRKWQYGLTLGVGFGTWNLYLYYGLNSLLENSYLNNEQLKFKPLNVGFIFYIM